MKEIKEATFLKPKRDRAINLLKKKSKFTKQRKKAKEYPAKLAILRDEIQVKVAEDLHHEINQDNMS